MDPENDQQAKPGDYLLMNKDSSHTHDEAGQNPKLSNVKKTKMIREMKLKNKRSTNS